MNLMKYFFLLQNIDLCFQAMILLLILDGSLGHVAYL